MEDEYFLANGERERNELSPNLTLGQILLDSGKWRFEFKKGDIVPNTDIGIQNSNFSFYHLLSLVSSRLFRVFRNLSTLVMIANIAFYAIYSDYWNSSFKVSFFAVCLLLGTGQSLLYFFIFQNEVMIMERYWSKMEIMRLNNSSKNGISAKPVKISKLKVGDIVYLKGDSISPADILVIDTSNQRHSDKIFHVSERRITGDNKIMTKSSVRNLNPIDQLASSPVAAVRKEKIPEGADRLLKKIIGHIEYDKPNHLVSFGGAFKLKNDPKVSRVSKGNVLFCGTKLYTSW